MSALNDQNSYINLCNNAFWKDTEELNLRAVGLQLH